MKVSFINRIAKAVQPKRCSLKEQQHLHQQYLQMCFWCIGFLEQLLHVSFDTHLGSRRNPK